MSLHSVGKYGLTEKYNGTIGCGVMVLFIQMRIHTAEPPEILELKQIYLKIGYYFAQWFDININFGYYLLGCPILRL